MTIGKRISELRKQNSYSQEYIAERVGVSRQAVSKWEQDQSAPDTYNLIALAELFGVTVEYLATGKEAGYVQPKEEPDVRSSSGTQRTVGFILLTTGLLALILGALFSEWVLLLSFFLLLIGIICLSVKKNIGLANVWGVLALILVLRVFTPGGWFVMNMINRALGNNGSVSLNMYTIAFLIIFPVALIVTIIKIIRNKRK